MATLKRTNSTTAREEPQPPPRACIICTCEDAFLIRPCRICDSDYCEDCLCGRFEAAVDDKTMMPARCCTLLHLHTVAGVLDRDEAEEYRKAFQEWITPVKTYCPQPACSVFIPEDRVPEPDPNEIKRHGATTLRDLLTQVIDAVGNVPSARFFREELPIDQLPGYANVVRDPMYLRVIRDNITNGLYKTNADLSKDMQLIVTNSRKCNGDSHGITRAAEELFTTYLMEISKMTQRLLKAANEPPPPPAIFSCPKCHIAICTTCKRIEHSGSPCDTSQDDHEMAMLTQYGYKRCPRCRAAVKKMFGCPHMQCLCGAHWCYYCQRAINECDGSCDARDQEDSGSGGEYYSEDDLDEDVEGEVDTVLPGGGPAIQATHSETTTHANSTNSPVATINHATAGVMSARTPDATRQPASQNAPANPQPDASRIVNLDAGGGRRWAEGVYDFGEEPDDEGFAQIWSCSHNFELHPHPPNDGFNHGNFERMECNRCFKSVQIRKSPQKPTKRLRQTVNGRRVWINVARASQDESPEEMLARDSEAYECRRCRVLVCPRCKDRFMKEVKQDD